MPFLQMLLLCGVSSCEMCCNNFVDSVSILTVAHVCPQNMGLMISDFKHKCVYCRHLCLPEQKHMEVRNTYSELSDLSLTWKAAIYVTALLLQLHTCYQSSTFISY